MSDLDQAALEAAAKAIYAVDPLAFKDIRILYDDHNGEIRGMMREFADAAIRAYQSAMAAQVREAVEAMLTAALEHEEAAQWRDWDSYEIIGGKFAEARNALLILLGAQETTNE